MEDVEIGKLLGYKVVLKDVPKERVEGISSIGKATFEKMFNDFVDKPFETVNQEIKLAKEINHENNNN